MGPTLACLAKVDRKCPAQPASCSVASGISLHLSGPQMLAKQISNCHQTVKTCLSRQRLEFQGGVGWAGRAPRTLPWAVQGAGRRKGPGEGGTTSRQPRLQDGAPTTPHACPGPASPACSREPRAPSPWSVSGHSWRPPVGGICEPCCPRSHGQRVRGSSGAQEPRPTWVSAFPPSQAPLPGRRWALRSFLGELCPPAGGPEGVQAAGSGEPARGAEQGWQPTFPERSPPPGGQCAEQAGLSPSSGGRCFLNVRDPWSPGPELASVSLQAPLPHPPSSLCDVTHGGQRLPHDFAGMPHVSPGAGRSQASGTSSLREEMLFAVIPAQRVSPGHVWGRLWLSQLGGSWQRVGGGRDAAPNPTVPRTPPSQSDQPQVSSARRGEALKLGLFSPRLQRAGAADLPAFYRSRQS